MKVLQMSCRKGFLSETANHEGSFCLLRWRGSDVLLDYDSLSFDESVQNVLILVHGYKGIFENVEKRYGMVESNLNNQYDLVIEFYWPGSWSASIGYVAATNRVLDSSLSFIFSLRLLFEKIPSLKKVVVMAHSLGSRIVTYCPLSFKGRENVDVQFVLAAPALNVDYMNEKLTINTLSSVDKIFVCYSRKDPVLKYFFRLVPENWFSPSIVFAIDKVKYKNIEWVDMTDVIGRNHSGYYNLKMV